VEFIEQIHQGVSGIVKDDSGAPVEDAAVHVDDRNHISHTQKDGDYWRILNPGSYMIKVIKDGYKSETKNIEIGSGTTSLNFVLKADPGSSSKPSSAYYEKQSTETTDPNSASFEYDHEQQENNQFPLLSQIQKIDQQLVSGASSQSSQAWQTDMQAFNAPTVSMGGNDLHANSPFQRTGSENLETPYESNTAEYFSHHPKAIESDDPMSDELNLEQQDFFDHDKGEVEGDAA